MKRFKIKFIGSRGDASYEFNVWLNAETQEKAVCEALCAVAVWVFDPEKCNVFAQEEKEN